MSVLKKVLVFCTILFFSGSIKANEGDLEKLLSIPYIDQIQGAVGVDRIVFTMNEGGRRNVYIADGPNYKVTKLTSFDQDYAQEISSLSISKDGKWIVFARGGDHGANSAPVATNSASFIEKSNIEIFTISVADKQVYKIGIGDFPIFHPTCNSITYFRNGQVWTSVLNQEGSGKQLFSVKGTAGNLQWSPDGKRLAFVSKRGNYSFVGIFDTTSTRIKWITPSYHTDHNPQWSPDGTKLAFVRRDAIGGAIDSITAIKFQPWSIMVADVDQDRAVCLYSAPYQQKASFPRIPGQVNLNWPKEEYITFLSYEDGWPHLYKVSTFDQKVTQLTKGNFSIDDISFSSNGDYAVFSANTGTDIQDFDRSHIGSVDVGTGKVKMLSSGESIETKPLFFYKDQRILWKSSNYDSPISPEVYDVSSKKVQKVARDYISTFNLIPFVKPTQVWIESADGVRFSAHYYTAKIGDLQKPALVYIHGGPRRQMYLGWHHIDYYFYDYAFNQYLVSKGYNVLVVNYRLGTGYGYDFQHPKSAGNLGASEYLDILAAAEWLRKQRDVDRNRIGVFGGSYGGYLTAMALAKNSDIFKAGVDIHGMHNRARKQNPEFYAPDFELASKLNWDSSPSKYVDSWKSPVLIIHGDDDQNVSFEQSIDLYNRLKDRGIKVETLVFPDENHHWQLFENLIKVKKRTIEFFDNNLK